MELPNKNMTYYAGMTLIEILVSLVILAIGMLGIASMLMVSNKTNSSSYTKQQAVQIVYDMFDRIRANSQVALTGSYNVSDIIASGAPTLPAAPSVLCTTSVCTPTQLAAYDTWYWLAVDVPRLPSGSGSVTTVLSATGNTVVTITVQWDDTPAQQLVGSSSAAGAVDANYVQLSIQSQYEPI